MTPDKSLQESVAGDYRVALEAIRDTLAASISSVDPDKRAPLAKQLVEVIDKLHKLPTGEASKIDDLAERRTARRASTQKRATGRDVSGPGGS